MNLLFFDLRESEKEFFNKHIYPDFNITFREDALTEKTKLSDEEYENTCILCVYRSSILTSKVLKKFNNLRMIATRSHGFTHIDLDYCMKNRINVINVEQYGEDAVAEFALGVIIDLTRKIKTAMIDIRRHNINPKSYEGELLNKKTIGIVGCGKVGIKLARIANFFDMKVLVSSYKEMPQFEHLCNVVPFDKLLAESDIIALHMPFTTENYQIIGEDEFEKMKNGVYIINTSSVELLNLEALYNNLLSGKVKGAGLDILESDFIKGKENTYSQELGGETMSTKHNYKITEKLLNMPNVLITPHLAYNTKEYINYVLEYTFNNIKDNIKGNYPKKIC
jgi:D-lactate dehydrogenase